MDKIDTDALVEQANFYAEEWVGTIIAALLLHDIKMKNYIAMAGHVHDAQKMSFDREYHTL